MTDRPRITRRRIGEAAVRIIGQIVLGFSFGLGLWLALKVLQ